jgi:hypothetical protein
MATNKENPKNRTNQPKNKSMDRYEEEHLKSSEELSNEGEVTPEDLEALGPEDLSMDLNEDEQLKQRVDEVDFEGDDLDVPGSELDDDQEEIGSEDEENNFYSLGSDDNDNLERGEP